MPAIHGTLKALSMSPHDEMTNSNGGHSCLINRAGGTLPGLLLQQLMASRGRLQSTQDCHPWSFPSPSSPCCSLCSTDCPVQCCPRYCNHRIRAGNTYGHTEYSQSMKKLRLLLADSTHIYFIAFCSGNDSKKSQGSPSH